MRRTYNERRHVLRVYSMYIMIGHGSRVNESNSRDRAKRVSRFARRPRRTREDL